MEHRWGRRITMDLPVFIECSGRTLTAYMRDASLSGAFISTNLSLSSGALVDVRIVSPLSDSSEQRLEASVVRTSDGGLGVEWLEFAPDPMCDLLSRLPSSGRIAQPRSRPEPMRPELSSSSRDPHHEPVTVLRTSNGAY